MLMTWTDLGFLTASAFVAGVLVTIVSSWVRTRMKHERVRKVIAEKAARLKDQLIAEDLPPEEVAAESETVDAPPALWVDSAPGNHVFLFYEEGSTPRSDGPQVIPDPTAEHFAPNFPEGSGAQAHGPDCIIMVEDDLIQRGREVDAQLVRDNLAYVAGAAVDAAVTTEELLTAQSKPAAKKKLAKKKAGNRR